MWWNGKIRILEANFKSNLTFCVVSDKTHNPFKSVSSSDRTVRMKIFPPHKPVMSTYSGSRDKCIHISVPPAFMPSLWVLSTIFCLSDFQKRGTHSFSRQHLLVWELACVCSFLHLLIVYWASPRAWYGSLYPTQSRYSCAETPPFPSLQQCMFLPFGWVRTILVFSMPLFFKKVTSLVSRILTVLATSSIGLHFYF